ncbi:hypothetical protein XarbCFBP7408_09555 [Xanthomonas arboricola pv. guizotiae]|uniref:Uncharacterized protein n=1 Tax=Xanthomonas arboricola pv. guizotiae TaxID=487867 RepID=A0A2S7A5B0_9XANT|nr:hypothetical protein XarbCFBP7409_05855 [Xanthomonas arboricola pv. guizotiae]PPU24213.1 hypothetical protein XarbCFBP7408_09555 [Xanthomonas arboricola pv. guizotiae]
MPSLPPFFVGCSPDVIVVRRAILIDSLVSVFTQVVLQQAGQVHPNPRPLVWFFMVEDQLAHCADVAFCAAAVSQ